MLEYILMLVPVVFLIASVYWAYKSVLNKKRSRKSALLRQIASFAAVGSLCLIGSVMAFAADAPAAASASDMNMGLSMLAGCTHSHQHTASAHR